MRAVITNAAGIRTTRSITAPQSNTVRRNNRGTEHLRASCSRRAVNYFCELIPARSKTLQTNSANAKRGARRLPVLLFLLCRPRSRPVLTDYDWLGFAADAHRMRGVISLCFALSPVESYRLFPWQVSSRLPITPM
jgi:hypothetical protein